MTIVNQIYLEFRFCSGASLDTMKRKYSFRTHQWKHANDNVFFLNKRRVLSSPESNKTKVNKKTELIKLAKYR